MPVNLREIQDQIKGAGAKALKNKEFLDKRRVQAWELLHTYDEQLDMLREHVKEARSSVPGLRCAIPCQEKLTHAVFPGKLPDTLTLFAADGSQIFPSRHQDVEYGAINIGVLQIGHGTGITPQETTHTRLFFPDPLDPQEELVTEEMIELNRDLWERELLADQSSSGVKNAIALTDGPLELFREPKESPQFKEKFQAYLLALDRATEAQVISAGYVDKPKADPVVRLLELLIINGSAEHPLRGVTDAYLYQDMLESGQRSAIFGLQSSSAHKFRDYSEKLALHFFYLNVGKTGQPYLARIEIPGWVANSPDAVDALHAALLWQCQQMGGRAYPYALHRAHEIAVISFPEKEQVDAQVMHEMLTSGVVVLGKSAKQANKDIIGSKKRFGQ